MPSNNKGYNKTNARKGNNQKYLRHILSSDPFNAKTIDLADEKQVKDQIVWYFNSCLEDDMKPSLAGLARCLGTDVVTLRRWRAGTRREGQAHGSLIKSATEIVQEMYVQYMNNGEINPVAGIFIMGNDFSYERETGTTINNIQITDGVNMKKIEDKYSSIAAVEAVENPEKPLLPEQQLLDGE